jgi:hypothetical protein
VPAVLLGARNKKQNTQRLESREKSREGASFFLLYVRCSNFVYVRWIGHEAAKPKIG